MKEISINGKKRTEVGKKATRELRKEGMVPCNLYGEAKCESGAPLALSFSAPFNELRKAVYSPDVYVINLLIDGEEHKAVMRELQFHPVTDALLHADFFEITADKLITVGIPVNLTGLAQGIRDGGRMNLSVRKLNVTAKYVDIPEKLDVDVTELTIGKSIKVGDLSYEGLTLATSKDVVVCSIKATRKSNMANREK